MPNLERALYGLPPPTRSRPKDKPLQLLCLGYSRSGTSSLRTALTSLGLQTYHGYDVPSAAFTGEAFTYLGRRKFGHLGGLGDMTTAILGSSKPVDGDCRVSAREFDLIVGHCEAVTDAPLACFAAELVAAYPDAKVLLNTRDVDAWYESYVGTFGAWDDGAEGWKAWARSWVVAELYWLERVKTFSQRTYFFGDVERTGKWVYRRHCDAIRGMLRDSPERLLEWRVEDGWDPLCKLLGREVPEGRAFPRGNEGSEFEVKVQQLLKGWNEKADQRLAMVAAFGSLFLGVLLAFTLYRLGMGT